MAGGARRAVAVLDVPDAAREREATTFRRAAIGDAAYEERYRGLDHLFFDRAWMARSLEACGLSDVRVEDQAIDGYANAAFRFNAFGFRR